MGRPAPNAAEKTQARLAGFNYRRRAAGAAAIGDESQRGARRGIEDVGPVKVMLESGIELDDVLYTLKGKIDRRAYLGNTALGHGPSTGSWRRLRKPMGGE